MLENLKVKVAAECSKVILYNLNLSAYPAPHMSPLVGELSKFYAFRISTPSA